MATVGRFPHAQAVTPDDTNNLRVPAMALSFANSGAQTLKVDMLGGETGVTIVLPSGMYEINVTKVYSTGTTVTSIVAYWNPQ